MRNFSFLKNDYLYRLIDKIIWTLQSALYKGLMSKYITNYEL